MTRLLVGATLALLLSSLLPPTTGFAETTPEFRLGFAALASQIPGIVGRPLENEWINPLTGDAMQRTSRGLLVWRKADNSTAFTDGTTTWLIGPFGLQRRPNGVRFDWEKMSATNILPLAAVTFTFAKADSGGWVGKGMVQNPLEFPVDVEINVIAFAPNGTPLMDAPTAFLRDLPSGATRLVTVHVSTDAADVDWRWVVDSYPSSARNGFSVDVGAGPALQVDAALAGTVAELGKLDDGRWLLRVAAESGVAVVEGRLPLGMLGNFVPRQRTVTLSYDLDLSSAWVRAAVLAHELQHAADAAAANVPGTPTQCLQAEAKAFARQSDVWTQLWRMDLPHNVDGLHAELSDVARNVAHHPDAFATLLTDRYRSECGPLP